MQMHEVVAMAAMGANAGRRRQRGCRLQCSRWRAATAAVGPAAGVAAAARGSVGARAVLTWLTVMMRERRATRATSECVRCTLTPACVCVCVGGGCCTRGGGCLPHSDLGGGGGDGSGLYQPSLPVLSGSCSTARSSMNL
jgi:hypothetical protein